MNNNHSERTPKQRRNSSKLPLILLFLILMIAVFLLGMKFAGGKGESNDFFFDSNAQLGYLPGKSVEEIQAELNRIVEEGMFNISIASIIVFPNGEEAGQARIENIEANHYHMQVTITLDEDGREVYKSGGIKPGEFLEYITLSEDLPKGEYNATAVFTAHHTEDLSKVGQAAAKIQLIVQE